jgi:low affinity Fe/Cu permease
MSKYISHYFDRLSDKTADWLGSTESILIHTVLFVGIFSLRIFDVPLEEILLMLTTAVSLEAIYLAIFIQRAVNKQSIKLEHAIDKIIQNVSENLEQPLDEVVGEIRQTVLETHRALTKTVSEESDQVVREVGQKVELETDDLEISLKN